ncbi:hypothetical protein G9A89_020067 [Geosiphon pyriformis]|nr:hypothetical protein G9A89_020067 [Geosiphon pyriformis]
MPPPHDICARVQNGFLARLKSIAIPDTNMNLAICNILYQQGFISSVRRGNHRKPDTTFTSTTPLNVATRRLWLELKFRDNQPVLHKMRLVSKSSRRIYMNVDEIVSLCSGRQAKWISSLQPGEIAIFSTDRGVLEARDAIKVNRGGEFLCRVF